MVVGSLVVVGSAVTASAEPARYNLKPARPGGNCLHVAGTAALVTECTPGDDTQSWTVSAAATAGYVRITSTSGQCLDILNDGKANNRLVVAKCANVSGQLWKLAPIGTSEFSTVTTAWRGDHQCLDIVNDQPVLAECRQVAGQRWQLAPATPLPKVDTRADRDGAVTTNRRFQPSFVIFTKACSLLLPTGDPDARPYTTRNQRHVFFCERTKAEVVCSINRFDDLGSRDYMFTAAVISDTTKTLQFATPKRLIDATVDTKSAQATVAQTTPSGASRCDGDYLTIEAWERILRDAEAEQRAASRNSGGGGQPSAPRTSSPPPASRAPAPKGDPKGRMCSKDKDCQSGSCAMENKTRGRCR